jgi:ABC-type Fe3+-hydroxamate transport system substrate-binding protein
MLIDAAGTAHPPAGDEARVVSLVPSITELLFEMGLGPRVVGRTRFCVHPREAVRRVAVIGGTKDVRLDAVRAVAPTHAVLNVDENLASDADALRTFVPHVIVTHPNAPEDNLSLFALTGGLFGGAARAEALGAALTRELEACAATDWPRERVLYLIWTRPWMTVAGDTYIARTLASVGWDVPHGPGGPVGAARYPVLEDLDAEVARVERVLLPSEPFRFRQRHARELRGRYPDVPVDLIDGEMTSWYGARAIAGLAYLRRYRADRPRRSRV